MRFITPRPESRRSLLTSVWGGRQILWVLAKKDFQTRYKRASLGLAWSVVVPILQASIMAVVFSRVVRVTGIASYPVYVMCGVVAYTYFAATLTTMTTAIIDNTNITDKVWFPRAILVLVPGLSNLVGLLASLVAVVALVPALHAKYGWHDLLIPPACVLLVALSTGLGLLAAALDVYFRDVKFIMQALLLVWVYVTPILYTKSMLGSFGKWIDINPLTGVVVVFHIAFLGWQAGALVPVAISALGSVALWCINVEVYRHHDRIFVDQL